MRQITVKKFVKYGEYGPLRSLVSMVNMDRLSNSTFRLDVHEYERESRTQGICLCRCS